MKLIGDIGGTNVRFALTDGKGKMEKSMRFRRKLFKNVTEAINAYKEKVEVNPEEAFLSINNVIRNGKSARTVNDWGYNSRMLERDTGLISLRVVNDATAHAMGIPHLKAKDKVKIRGGKINKLEPLVVIGVGTSIGTSYATYNECKGGYDYHSSQGGSPMISLSDYRHAKILEKFLRYYKYARWSTTTSGNGLHYLYHAIHDEQKPTDNIMKEFLAGCPKAAEVFEVFYELLGMLCRNMAAIFMPFGGIYITGGVLNKPGYIEPLKRSNFSEYYEFRGRDDSYIRDVPIYVVTNDDTALIGLAHNFP